MTRPDAKRLYVGFLLHRRDLATKHLQPGIDLRAVQVWLNNWATMRYLKPARGKGIREKVNATFGVAGFSV